MSGKIDVSELMSDPDFVGPIVHIRRKPVVNGFGQQILTECKTEMVGSVQPMSAKNIDRVPESLRVKNLLTFFVKGKIVATEGNQYPDILVYQGFRFQVLAIRDWSSWGGGYSEGECVAEVIS